MAELAKIILDFLDRLDVALAELRKQLADQGEEISGWRVVDAPDSQEIIDDVEAVSRWAFEKASSH